MKRILVVALGTLGCGSVKDKPGSDAPPARDAASADGRPADAGIDAPDLSAHVVFVTSTAQAGALGGIAGADGICQLRAQAANLTGTFKAWLADVNGSPATRMTRHLGPYQLVSGAVIAQGWNDLTDGTLLHAIDRTETGGQLGGPGCQPGASCNFVCEGGEVWSNVDASGNRRAGVNDCTSWTGAAGANGTAGNDGKVDALWTAGTCTPITCGSALPIFCVQQ